MKVIKDLELALGQPKKFNSQFQEYSDKNILWITPQLTGRQLYKSILPYLILDDDSVFTAMNGIEKHNPELQLLEIDVYLDSKQLLWADTLVIPFTAQPLTELYESIRNINPSIKIIYSVDFNYDLISQAHPYAPLFRKKQVKEAIEENMFFADTVLVSNKQLAEYLKHKLSELGNSKYKKPSKVKVGCAPFLMDEAIVRGNFDHEPVEQVPKNGKLRIGVVATNVYAEDINSYVKVFKQINQEFKDKVQLVLFGYDGKSGNKNSLEGVDFEFHKPTSIIHYFKKLHSLNLDLMLIPLKESLFNNTSENYNKWLESSIFGIPILVHS